MNLTRWLGMSIAMMPLWFVLGVGGFVWALIGLVAVAQLVDRRRAVALPWAGPALVALVAWIPLSGVLVLGDGLATVLLFGYRWLVFVSLAAVFALLVADPDAASVATTARRAMVGIWLTCIVLGAASFVAPRYEIPTPAGLLTPSSFAQNEYLSELTGASLSEVQVVDGEISTRPSAPFAYTNGWAAAVGLTFPLALVVLVVERHGRARLLGAVVCAVGVVVSVGSLNRWLWISMVVTGIYLALKADRRHRRNALIGLAAAGGVVLITIVATPLGARIDDRLSSADDSNRWRSAVIETSIEASLDSPFVGYGDPEPVSDGPPLGTHGLAWYLLYSHGAVAVLLFGGWLIVSVVRSARVKTPMGAAAGASLLAGLLAMPVYGLVPQLPLLGIAAALAWQEDRRVPTPV